MMLGEVGARMARDGKRGGVSVLVFLVSLGQLTFFWGGIMEWRAGQKPSNDWFLPVFFVY